MIEYQKNVLRGIEQYKEEIEQLKQENEQLKELCELWGRFTQNLEVGNGQLKNHIVDVKQHHCKLHDAITERAEKAELENKQLKEALKKCSPHQEYGSYECEDCGQLKIYETLCNFCGNDLENGHADDCEYMRLTGGAE